MYLTKVLNVLSCLKTEGKFFLISLLNTINKDKEITWNYKQLSKQYGCTDKTIKEVLNYLVANDYLTECSRAVKVGKPTKQYKLSLECKSVLLNKSNDCNYTHIKIIKDLLFSVDKNKYNKLRVSNRLLLILLLSVANNFGASNHYGNSELCKLVGIGKDALKNQLNKLIKLGFINAVIKGGSSKYLFGVTKASYYLNLEHDEFSLVHVKTAKFICLVEHGYELQLKRYKELYVRDLYKLIKKLQSWYVPPLKSNTINTVREKYWKGSREKTNGNTTIIPIVNYQEFQNIACFFMRGLTSSDKSILQLKLNNYISFLLSNHFSKLSDGKEKSITPEAINKIKPSLFPRGLLDTIERGEVFQEIISSKKQVDQFCEFFIRIAIIYAKKIQCILVENNSVRFSDMKLYVRPNFYHNDVYFVIDSDFKVENETYYFYEMTTENAKSSYSGITDVIIEEEQFRYGFLSKANEKDPNFDFTKLKIK